MALKNIPVVLDGYELMIVVAPEVKVKTDSEGNVLGPDLIWGTDNPKYVVKLFAQPPADAKGRRGKGEEISVTLLTDPGDGWKRGDDVALRRATVSLTAIVHPEVRNAFKFAGLSFQAEGLSPAVSNAGSRAA